MRSCIISRVTQAGNHDTTEATEVVHAGHNPSGLFESKRQKKEVVITYFSQGAWLVWKARDFPATYPPPPGFQKEDICQPSIS